MKPVAPRRTHSHADALSHSLGITSSEEFTSASAQVKGATRLAQCSTDPSSVAEVVAVIPFSLALQKSHAKMAPAINFDNSLARECVTTSEALLLVLFGPDLPLYSRWK